MKNGTLTVEKITKKRKEKVRGIEDGSVSNSTVTLPTDQIYGHKNHLYL